MVTELSVAAHGRPWYSGEPRVRAHLDGERDRLADALRPLQPRLHVRGHQPVLSYEEGCRSDCGCCGLARSRPGTYEDRSFIRVEWPLVPTDELVEGIVRFEPKLTRIASRWSPTATPTATPATSPDDRRSGTDAISVLVAPPTLNGNGSRTSESIGVDMIGIGLDAVTEELFADIRTEVSAGGLKWDGVLAWRHWRTGSLRGLEGRRADRGRAGRDRRRLVSLFVALRDRQNLLVLFCFNPEPVTRMAARPKPTLMCWRRLRLASQLIETEGYGLERFGFDSEGGLARIRAGRPAIERS